MRLRSIGLLVTLALGILAAPLAAAAQPAGKVYRVAVFGLLPREAGVPFLKALESGLRDLGYVEGRNLVLEYHTAEGRPERLPEVAAELVRLKFDVLITSTNEVTAAAKRATTTVPIVMALGGNPVGAGFIASLARPGGNITGVTFDAEPEAYAKPLQFLKETLPHLSRVAVLRSPGPAWQPMWDAARDAASKLAIELQPLDLRTPADIEPAFATMKKERLRAFLFWADPVTYPSRKQVADLSIKNGLASASLVRQFADAGGLMAYGPSILDLF